MNVGGKVSFALFCLCSACLSQADDGQLAKGLEATRSSIPPIAAEYTEEVSVTNPDKSGIGVGHQDSKSTLTCAIDALSSSKTIGEYSIGDHKIGEEKYFTGNKGFYEAHSDSTQGRFGSRPSGFINPISVGFDFISEPMVSILKTKPVQLIDSDNVDIQYNEDGKFRCTFVRFGTQLFVSKIDGGSARLGNRQVIETESWMEVKNTHIPRVSSITFYENGSITQVRKYTFVKLLPELMKPLEWKWKEGAIVKNADTQKVYVVKDGQLVLDPRFMKAEAASITLRRVLFILCGVGVAAWVAFRIKMRSKNAGLTGK